MNDRSRKINCTEVERSEQLVLVAKQLTKSYPDGKSWLTVLSDLDLSIQAGELVAIVGRSGSGKSTLLHILAGLDRPDSGEVWLQQNQELSRLAGRNLDVLHNELFGFIFQFHYLLPELNLIENVMLPAWLNHRWSSKDEVYRRAKQLLVQVELLDKQHAMINELSGGQRQRAAIARALINLPICVLADEPTGNLDQHTAEQIVTLIRNMTKQHRTAFVVVTHDLALANSADRSYTLLDGKLQCDR